MKNQPEGAPPVLSYQPQHAWSDGDFFDMWSNIGEPTISKRLTRDRLEVFRSIHGDAKLRVLRIVSSAEVIDLAEFLPVVVPTRPDTPQTRDEDRQAEQDLAKELAQSPAQVVRDASEHGNCHQSQVNAQAADNWRQEAARLERENTKLRRYVDFVERYADADTVKAARIEAEGVAETMPPKP